MEYIVSHVEIVKHEESFAGGMWPHGFSTIEQHQHHHVRTVRTVEYNKSLTYYFKCVGYSFSPASFVF